MNTVCVAFIFYPSIGLAVVITLYVSLLHRRLNFVPFSVRVIVLSDLLEIHYLLSCKFVSET